MEMTFLGIWFTTLHVLTTIVFAYAGSYAIEKFAGPDSLKKLQDNARAGS